MHLITNMFLKRTDPKNPEALIGMDRENIVQYNNQVANNREYAKRLFTDTRYVSCQAVPFCGHDESGESG